MKRFQRLQTLKFKKNCKKTNNFFSTINKIKSQLCGRKYSEIKVIFVSKAIADNSGNIGTGLRRATRNLTTDAFFQAVHYHYNYEKIGRSDISMTYLNEQGVIFLDDSCENTCRVINALNKMENSDFLVVSLGADVSNLNSEVKLLEADEFTPFNWINLHNIFFEINFCHYYKKEIIWIDEI